MKRSFSNHKINVCILIVALVLAIVSAAAGAKNDSRSGSVIPTPAATPIYTGYKGVKIGMSDEEARKLLGTPKEKGDDQDYFVFSESESAQVLYDTTHKVTTVSVTYIGKTSSIPTPKAIFGEDAEVKADGSINKIVRYPKNGISISYNRTAGDDPLVMITVQKIYGTPES